MWETSFTGERTDGLTDEQTDTTKLIVAFLNSATAPKSLCSSVQELFLNRPSLSYHCNTDEAQCGKSSTMNVFILTVGNT